MYRLTVTVVEVMDLYDIHATLWDTSDVTGATERISHSHSTLGSDPLAALDPFASILYAIKQWSEMTIQD
jgi:hypothetical protein